MNERSNSSQNAFELAGRGLQHQGLRRANERAVLTVVGFNGGLSNADISRLTGLAPQTVSAILVEQERAGLIVRGEVLRGRRGQPATPIFLNPIGAYGVGVEIGWRHCDVLLINLHAQVLSRIHHDYDFPDARTVLALIGDSVAEVIGQLPETERAKVQDVGVAMPTQLGKFIQAVGAPDEQGRLWDELDVAAILANLTGLEVSVHNDGSAACWAELIAAPAPRPANFIYLMVSCFVGAGIVGQSTLWEGPTGSSANLGSMLIANPNGRQQTAHEVASLTALERRLAAAGRRLDAPLRPEHDWASLEPVLSEWLVDASRALATVIVNTQAVIENELAIISGLLPDDVLARLVEGVQREILDMPMLNGRAARVVAGKLDGAGPAIGAAELPIYRRYFSRSLADLAV